MLSFHKVQNKQDIKQTAELAEEIWNQHFIKILSQEQINYMVQKFQSEHAMTSQIQNGYSYYMFDLDGEKIGYFAVCPENDKTLFLSKLYIKKEYRGNGYASKAFEFIKEIARENNLYRVWLTVNRNNSDTIAVYKHFGMNIIREQVTDIGNNFVMDDFVFAYDL